MIHWMCDFPAEGIPTIHTTDCNVARILRERGPRPGEAMLCDCGAPFKNRALSDLMYQEAIRDFSFCPHGLGVKCPTCYPPVPFWRRLRSRIRNWMDAYRPHVHLGPCPDDDEDW